jgi:hypothetical protein
MMNDHNIGLNYDWSQQSYQVSIMQKIFCRKHLQNNFCKSPMLFSILWCCQVPASVEEASNWLETALKKKNKTKVKTRMLLWDCP